MIRETQRLERLQRQISGAMARGDFEIAQALSEEAQAIVECRAYDDDHEAQVEREERGHDPRLGATAKLPACPEHVGFFESGCPTCDDRWTLLTEKTDPNAVAKAGLRLINSIWE